MIALVITIIVLLILSGVSINAIVGDNGVLSKATDATYSNACAILEEYFNQLYATMAIDGVDEFETPLHTIMKNGYQHVFFSTTDGYCLKKNFVDEESGEKKTLVLYLVKKEQLPEEIRSQLQGGDGLESRDYRKLKGVYGITSDLQAYYCKNGLENMLGLNISDLNADSPDIVFSDETSVLAGILNGGTEPVTNQDLKAIKSLNINSVEKLALLSDFDKFTNLTTLYFENITIPNLNGIADASAKLTYVKFTNCNVQDYSALNGLTKLNQLYIVRPAGMNEEIARLGTTDKGIAAAEFSNLQYFGIVGYDGYLNSSSTSYASDRYGVSDISSLDNFSDTTKQAIKYMNLQNLQLTSIAALKDFINVYLIRLEENALTTFDGIQNMNTLRYLVAPYQYSNASATTVLGNAEGDAPSDTDALKYIYKDASNANTALYYVDLRSNNKLKYVDGLSSCSGIRYLYLAGCSLVQNASTVGTVIGRCGANYSIDGKYGLDIIADTTTVLSLSGKTMTITEFEDLQDRTSLTHLNLSNIVLKTNEGVTLTNSTSPTFNDEVNKVLKTCMNLKYLQLVGLSNLNTIDFINNCSGIIELDLYGTAATDLSLLETKANNLRTLRINNNGIDLTTIQNTIMRCQGGSYWVGGGLSGFIPRTWDLVKQLENCTNLTRINTCMWGGGVANLSQTLDLSNLTNLTSYNVSGLWCTVKLPEKVTSLSVDQCGPFDFSLCTDITTISITATNYYSFSKAQWDACFESLQNANKLTSFSIGRTYNISYPTVSTYLGALPNLKTLRLGTIQGSKIDQWTNLTNLDGLEGMTNIETLSVPCLKINNLKGIENLTNLKNLYLEKNEITDISSLKNLVNLETLVLNENQIRNINAISNMINLKYLNVNNNNITDIYPLYDCTNLETLYIQNNALSDVSSHKREDGTSLGYETMDVFYDLNFKKKGALKNLYISGNVFDDTEILLDLTWSAKSGF